MTLAGAGIDVEMRNCVVQMEGICKLRTCFVKLEKCAGVPAVQTTQIKGRKLTKEEKIILLPHKKSAAKKSLSNSVKKGRITKSKKDSKFQLKLTSFFTSPAPKQKSDRCTPDSGIASRSESPDSDELSNDEEAEENIDDTSIKQDFLKSLDTGDSDDEGNESDEAASESEDDDGSDWEEQGSKVPTYKPKKKTQKKAVHQPIKFDKGIEKSEYENERDKNIEEKDKLLQALKAQWNNFKVATAKPKPKPRSYTYNYTNEDGTVEVRRSTRSVGVTPKYAAGLDDDWRPPSQKRARHDYFEEGTYRPVQRGDGRCGGQGRTLKDANVDVLMPEDITENMLKNIHYYGKKVYNKDTGSSCHQCRQKTTDQKTICRSGVCAGVRGQFCGTCLENRYGESVAEALKDPEWSCPPCRNICNCSFCLETPTGILIHIARAKGFKSVHQYLQHLRSKWDEEKGESQEESEEIEEDE